MFTFVQKFCGWKNIPGFEGNLEFWAKKLRDVPIHSAQDYSKLLEMSASMLNDSNVTPPHGNEKKSPGKFSSFLFKPKRNSTLVDDPRKAKRSQARLNAAKDDKDNKIALNDLDSNPIPPAAVATEENEAVIDIE